jgi:hypothetical protein
LQGDLTSRGARGCKRVHGSEQGFLADGRHFCGKAAAKCGARC